jgi:hypothetical protein
MTLPRQMILGPSGCLFSSLLLFACAGADTGGQTSNGTAATTGGTVAATGGDNGSGGTTTAGGGVLANGGARGDIGGATATGNATSGFLSGGTTGASGIGGSTVGSGTGGSTSAGRAGIGGSGTGGLGTGGSGIGGSTSAGRAGIGGSGTGGLGTGGSGTGGSTSAGRAGIGGSGTGGLGTGGSATGGLGTGGSAFWKTVTYSSTGLPNPSDGNHNQGQNCRQCHDGSTNAPVWMFGGTVYLANGTTPAPNVQVGVNDGTNLFTAYSATNGNFWVAGTRTVNWATAEVRIRNAKGELTMAGATPAATCNLCHNSTTYPRITAP